MSTVQQQVHRARRRLWLATWLEVGCRLACWALAAFALYVLVLRLGGWTLPILWVGAGLAATALIASFVWAARIAPDEAEAAARLDAAAGLRERISSSLYCETSDDPFARAVRADAETRANSVTVRQHLRLSWPQTTGWAVCAVVLAAAVFLVPQGWLRGDQAKARALEQTQVVQTRVEIKKQLDDVKKLAQTNPALADLKQEMEKLDADMMGRMQEPADLRQEAIKKIDRLSDAVREKQQSERFDKVSETKRMLRALEEPQGDKTPVQQLAKELQTGDFKAASETIKKMQEQLATLKQDSDKEFVEKMQKQLEQLAKQMDQLANQDQLKKQLEQSGIKKEDVERMLERLSKEDLDKIREQLEKNGMTQQQINQVCQQCQKQQGAASAMKQMSQAMKNAAQAAGAGQMGDAAGQMEAAGEQLSELEQLEQEMNQLQSAMSSLDQARGNCQGNKPGQGQGQGQGNEQNEGSGMGNLGQGKGGLANSQKTDVGFKVERGEVKTTKGRIIGQFLVDGEQVKGEATDEFVELITAAERAATDTVNRERLPRQYQKSVREYFSRLPGDFGIKGMPKSAAGGADAAAPDASTPVDASSGDSAGDGAADAGATDE
ncbi:MAG TPA: hypothetical protein P5572_02755 [Phycisphaerae bacterium]|nr:hypothetical protein [Phycisphaerae bacterium]